MERIIKYRSWFSTIGWLLTIIFSPRFLDNPWAQYAGVTLVAIGLNMVFFSDKREDGKIGIYNTIAALFITGLWLSSTYYMIKDHLL